MRAAQARLRGNDPLGVALSKTIGSMILSVLVYAYFLSTNYVAGLVIACVLVLLILVHEMGHVITMRFYGLRAGPPIFIPFLGALINMRQRRAMPFRRQSSASAAPSSGRWGR